MSVAAVAFDVFALIASGLLGIIGILLPHDAPAFVSDLQRGHSLLRIGIGLNTDSPETLGGTIPSITVFNEEKVQIGRAPGSSSAYVGNGTFTTVTVYHDDGHTFQQPTYVEVAGGPDAVCIAYLAQTWADGTQLGWLGDMGKFCGAKWYVSNTYVGTKNGSMYKPYCTWIGSSSSNSTQKDVYTYSGFKIHTPDFGPSGPQHDFSVPANPSELCTFPKIEWYKAPRFQTSSAPCLRPLAIKSLVVNAFGLLGLLANSIVGAAVTLGKRIESSEVLFRKSIIASHDSQHSSRELCASPTSLGPDFVSFEEGLFCDMSLKKTWPLCNEETKPTKECFDWESKTVVKGGKGKREIKYKKVVEWR